MGKISLIPNLQGHREQVLHPASKSTEIHVIQMWRILDIPVHHSRTSHKKRCGNLEQAPACIRLCSLTQKYCQLLKVGQVWSSQQHPQTSNSDLSAWQSGSNTVFPWHVCVASSPGVTSMSATLSSSVSLCRDRYGIWLGQRCLYAKLWSWKYFF